MLVVEDEDGVRGVVIDVLAEAGYTVLSARDGPQALAQLCAVRRCLDEVGASSTESLCGWPAASRTMVQS